VKDDEATTAAETEARLRYANEYIEKTSTYPESPETMQVLCECGAADCATLMTVTPGEYEEVRTDPTHFVVVGGHVLPDIERVVRETDRFVVVAKRAGTPAEVAREEDPRT